MQSAFAVSSSVVCPDVQYFFFTFHKKRDFFIKNVIEQKMCVLDFSDIFLILRRTERNVIKKSVLVFV